MDWSAVFSVTVLHGYIPQILLAEALYTLRLPRGSRFRLRLCIGLPVCAFLAVVIPNIVAQFTAGLFSILIFLLTFALCCFLFESRWTHVLFCCVSAQFTQNLSYNIESLAEMPLGEISLWQTGAISVACMALVYLVCYMLFARRIKVIRMDARWVLPMAVACPWWRAASSACACCTGFWRIKTNRRKTTASNTFCGRKAASTRSPATASTSST